MAKNINGMSVARDVAIKIMSRVPCLDKLKGKSYYDVEDVITEILDNNVDVLYSDRQHSFLCADVVAYMQRTYGIDVEDDTEFLFMVADMFIDENDANISHWDNLCNAIHLVLEQNKEAYAQYYSVVCGD